jgi:hypothetical protein
MKEIPILKSSILFFAEINIYIPLEQKLELA